MSDNKENIPLGEENLNEDGGKKGRGKEKVLTVPVSPLLQTKRRAELKNIIDYTNII